MAEEAKEDKIETKPPKSKMKKFIIAAVLLIGVVSGMMVMKMKSAKTAGPVEFKVGETFAMEEFLVNLRSDHYLRVTMGLGLREGESLDKMKEKSAKIRDTIVIALSDHKMEELETSEGKRKLAEEIKSKVNKSLSDGSEKDKKKQSPPTVLEVYFSSFAMQ